MASKESTPVVSTSEIFQLFKKLHTTQQGINPVEVYYTEICTIWKDLSKIRPKDKCTCGGLRVFMDHLDSEFVIMFLVGLNESFTQICSQILSIDPLPSIDQVFALVAQVEHQRTSSPPEDQNDAEDLEFESSRGTNEIPTSQELEEFLASAEHEHRQREKAFIDKYNYDTINDKPLDGRYEWL